MLSFNEKREIFNSFKELSEVSDKYGRYFYYYYDSKSYRKLLVRDFSLKGSGYVYCEVLPEYKDNKNDRGWINIKDFTQTRLKDLVSNIIKYHSE